MFEVNQYGDVICQTPDCADANVHLSPTQLPDSDFVTYLPSADLSRPHAAIRGECESGHEFIVLYGNGEGMTVSSTIYRHQAWTQK